jgi:hypothetical protein
MFMGIFNWGSGASRKKYFSEIIDRIKQSTTIEELCDNDRQYERNQFVRTKVRNWSPGEWLQSVGSRKGC